MIVIKAYTLLLKVKEVKTMAEKYFYSNCLFQALKAKLKNPKQVKITYVSPFDNEVFCPHFLWTDGKNDYDFGIERHLPLYKVLFFKGHIRKRNLGFNQKYKNACKKYKERENNG